MPIESSNRETRNLSWRFVLGMLHEDTFLPRYTIHFPRAETDYSPFSIARTDQTNKLVNISCKFLMAANGNSNGNFIRDYENGTRWITMASESAIVACVVERAHLSVWTRWFTETCASRVSRRSIFPEKAIKTAAGGLANRETFASTWGTSLWRHQRLKAPSLESRCLRPWRKTIERQCLASKLATRWTAR